MESLVIDKSFWQGKRVLLTGDTGFKGSWMSLWLSELGAQVSGLSLPAQGQKNLFEQAAVASRIKHVDGDITDLDYVCRVLQQERPEIVIHMAAQSLVRESYLHPAATYQVNVIGTLNVLEAIRKIDSVRSCVIVTTDKCYENKEWLWPYRETDALGGYDPYSSSKACVEILTASYRQSFFNSDCYKEHQTAIATARAGNVIGGGDWAKDRLVPDIIRSCLSGDVVRVRQPSSIRPWQHVLEPLAGYLLLAEQLYSQGAEYSGAWNFGPSDSGVHSVRDLVSRLINRWGDGSVWLAEETADLHEAGTLKLDSSQANTRLKWNNRMNFESTVGSIVSWHKACAAGEDAQQQCLAQIAEYQRLEQL